MLVGNGEMYMNNIMIVGTLSTDIKPIGDGKIVTFQINDRNGKERQFVDCVAFNQNAENIKRMCKKYTLISVVGSLSLKPYTNKDGKEVKTTKVIVSLFEVLKDGQEFSNMKLESSQSHQPKNVAVEQPKEEYQSVDSVNIDDSDLPF